MVLVASDIVGKSTVLGSAYSPAFSMKFKSTVLGSAYSPAFSMKFSVPVLKLPTRVRNASRHRGQRDACRRKASLSIYSSQSRKEVLLCCLLIVCLQDCFCSGLFKRKLFLKK